MPKKRFPIVPVLIALLAFFVLAGWFTFHQKTVILEVDGDLQNLSTRALTVGAALDQAGVTYTDADSLDPSPGSLLWDGMNLVVWHASQVTIQDGLESTTLASTANSPAEWLLAAGLSLNEGDRLFVDGVEIPASQTLPYAPAHLVEIRRPLDIELLQDGRSRTFTTTALTVGEALTEAGVTLYPTDRLDPPLDTPLNAPLTVTLLSSRPLTIQVGQAFIQARASADTVGAALAQAGLSLQGLDYSLPAETEPVPADGKIRVVRVLEELNLETETIPFDTIFQAQADMDIDIQKVVQFGQSGLAASRTRIRYEDGAEISRSQEAKQILQEPVSQIEGFGTRITVQTMSAPEGTVEYYRALDFYATSYYPKMTSPPWYGAVACGGKWQPGYVAVDLNYVPCGTRLYIPGYGFAVAMDTAYISGAWIDLGYPDDGYVIWHRHVTVYFLTPIPAQVHWVIPPGTLY
jgi:uncharacterized protein YabE (DUF348 family)